MRDVVLLCSWIRFGCQLHPEIFWSHYELKKKLLNIALLRFFFNKSILRMCFNITTCRVAKSFEIFKGQLPIKISTQNGCYCLQSLCKSPKKQLKIVWNLLNYRTKLLIIFIISATICIESPKYVFLKLFNKISKCNIYLKIL